MRTASVALCAASGFIFAACATPGTTPVESAPVPATITTEDVTLKTPTGDVFGTLELPAARTPVPVALIIAGSGPTDRNGNTPALPGKNNSLKMLADGLAARGIASLRYDKRGIAASRAAMTAESDLRFTHFIDDAAAWAKQLRSDGRFSTLTVIGHSEGSLIGMVAAHDAGADGFISLEGAGRKAQDLLVEQLKPRLPPEMFAQTERILAALTAGTTPDSVPPVLAPLFRPSVMPYLISWFKYDPAAEIGKLTIPVLIVQGTTDIQTTMTDANALAAGNPSAKLLTIEGMNHVLKEASGDRLAQLPSYSDSTLTVVPKLIDEVAAFIKALPKRAVADSWGSADKIKHFFLSAFVESVAFSGLQAVGASRNTAFAGAIGTTAGFSVAKELHDRKTTGMFSYRDLVWDAAGAGAGFVMLRSTQK